MAPDFRNHWIPECEVAAATYPEDVASMFPNGEPLFWQDLHDVSFFLAFFKTLCVTHVFDLTAGHGSAAIAAVLLGLKSDGVAISDQHLNFLDNLLDSAIWPIIADSTEDKVFAGEVSRCFASLVEQGRRLLENDKEPPAEEQQDEQPEEEDEE